jgi:hypothetical protein
MIVVIAFMLIFFTFLPVRVWWLSCFAAASVLLALQVLHKDDPITGMPAWAPAVWLCAVGFAFLMLDLSL